ncbi:MAG: hypothetical protein KTR32_23475 [Granulosicoccus sp.]|nr:hypothetical protein [Granulosicoccus sp.]
MKHLIAAIILLSLISCSEGSESGASNDESSVFASDIFGAWVVLEDATQCENRYVFSSDNTFTLNSLDESIVGTYRFLMSSNSTTLFDLLLEVTSDNGLTDCDGGALDNTGSNYAYIVEFIEENKMTWTQILPNPFSVTLVKQ